MLRRLSPWVSNVTIVAKTRTITEVAISADGASLHDSIMAATARTR